MYKYNPFEGYPWMARCKVGHYMSMVNTAYHDREHTKPYCRACKNDRQRKASAKAKALLTTPVVVPVATKPKKKKGKKKKA